MDGIPIAIGNLVDQVMSSREGLQKRFRHLLTAYYALCDEVLARHRYNEFIAATGHSMVTLSDWREYDT